MGRGLLERVWLDHPQGCRRQPCRVGTTVPVGGHTPFPGLAGCCCTLLSEPSWAPTALPETPSSHLVCPKQTLARCGPQPALPPLPPPHCLPPHFPSCEGNINRDGVCLIVFFTLCGHNVCQEARQEFVLAGARLCFWGNPRVTGPREVGMRDATWCHSSPEQQRKSVIPILQWGN